ncbi:hypothetical protein D9615_007033 [Tricholomella constricta]|uniref:Uncharacterized protein n=1 Tax=Tricholomella constricta TaxID=117010 RepID=A0A8H5H8A2_9AGAR|nr:hypothetical protein D9615_007033 [Tricholomella constricta]
MKLTAVSAFLMMVTISGVNARPQFYTTNSGTDAGTTTCITFTYGDSTSTTVITYTPTPTATTTLPPSPTVTVRSTTTAKHTSAV